MKNIINTKLTSYLVKSKSSVNFSIQSFFSDEFRNVLVVVHVPDEVVCMGCSLLLIHQFCKLQIFRRHKADAQQFYVSLLIIICKELACFGKTSKLISLWAFISVSEPILTPPIEHLSVQQAEKRHMHYFLLDQIYQTGKK